jgi:hypothetical protein
MHASEEKEDGSPAVAASAGKGSVTTRQHAPLPFSANFDDAVKIKDAHGNSVLMMMQIHLNGWRDPNEVNNTAKLIVTACNSHHKLVEALRAQVAADIASMGGPEDHGYVHWQELENRAKQLIAEALSLTSS